MHSANRTLIVATGRHDKLLLSSRTSCCYLTDIDTDQVEAQIATFDAAITAHKNTLL